MGEINEQRVRESAAEATSWKDFAAQEKRNRDIWHRRFVLNDTLQSIAEDYGISRQRVLAIFKREQKRLAREV